MLQFEKRCEENLDRTALKSLKRIEELIAGARLL